MKRKLLSILLCTAMTTAMLIYFFSSRQRLSAENSSSSIITTLYSLSIVNNPALVINGTKVLKHVLTHKPDTPVMEL